MNAEAEIRALLREIFDAAKESLGETDEFPDDLAKVPSDNRAHRLAARFLACKGCGNNFPVSKMTWTHDGNMGDLAPACPKCTGEDLQLLQEGGDA